MRLQPPVRLLLIAGLLAAAGLTAPPAAAQRADTTATQRYRLAQMYQQAGQFDRAIALYEDLHADDPENPVFFDRLKTAYTEAKRYDEALALVDDRLDHLPGAQVALLATKAQLLHLAGREDEARATWQTAIEEAPDQRSTYQVVNRSLIEARLFDQAIATMQQGRTALGAPDAFRIEMAYLYSLTGQHTQAIDEYAVLLREEEGRLAFVQQRLGRFMEREEARKQNIAALDTALQATPEVPALLRLMGWLYLEDGQYEDALETYRTLDGVERGSGSALLRFAQLAGDAGAFGPALAAYRELIDRYPDGSGRPAAYYGLGTTYERWAEAVTADADTVRTRYRAALEAYRAYLERFPQGDAFPDVLRRVGRIEQDVLYAYDDAQKTLQEVIRRYPNTHAADLAQYDLGRLALTRGNLEAARDAFTALAERLPESDLRGTARYETALLDFYTGSFGRARMRLDSLSTDPAANVLNDALTLRLLLSEGMRGGDSTHAALRLYAEARLRQRQHRPADALALADTFLQQHGRHALTDDVRYLRAETLRRMDRPAEAVAAFSELALMLPSSPLADRSLFEAGRLYEQALSDPTAAVTAYNRLLEAYPGSLLAPEARQRLRVLWDDDA